MEEGLLRPPHAGLDETDWRWSLVRGALSGAVLSDACCAAAAYLDDGLTPPDLPTSLCSTHWLPLNDDFTVGSVASVNAPRHALEAAVLEVARVAAAIVPDGTRVAGLEWWESCYRQECICA